MSDNTPGCVPFKSFAFKRRSVYKSLELNEKGMWSSEGREGERFNQWSCFSTHSS